MTTAAELATPALLSPLESLCCPDGVSDNICAAIIMAMGIENIVSQKSLQLLSFISVQWKVTEVWMMAELAHWAQ